MQRARVRRGVMVCTFLLGLALAAMPVAAQTGQVRGRVLDEKNQPVEGAVVTIEAVEGTGRKFTVKSNRRGEFTQIGLQPGVYKVTATKDRLRDEYTNKVGLDTLDVVLTLRPGSDVTDEDRKKAEARIASVKTNFDAGVALTNQEKYDEALAKFNEVIALAPKCAECYANIATIHVRKKEYDQAEAAYKKWLEVTPNAADAYNGLANLYNSQKKFDQAAEASAQAQKLGAAAPGGVSASAVFNQGVIAWNASKFADAKKAFEEAIRLDPKLADAHYLLGMANLNEGKMPDAAKAFEEYLKLAPTGQYAEQAKNILAQIKK